MDPSLVIATIATAAVTLGGGVILVLIWFFKGNDVSWQVMADNREGC